MRVKKLLTGIFIMLLLISNTACQSKTEKAYQKITPDEAHRRLQEEEGIILLDVRTAEEYNQGHIPDSILLPVDKVKDGIKSVVQDKNTIIFVYCRSGNRSATAAQILADMGYTKVYDLGGINAWKYELQP